MQISTINPKGLTVLVNVHADRLLGLVAVGIALLAGAWLGSLGLR